jgi:hypothetical protein
VPGNDAAVKLQDRGLQRAQLTAKSSKAHPGDLRDSVFGFIGEDFQQLLDATPPNRCDNPELDKMGADRVDDGGLLADERWRAR